MTQRNFHLEMLNVRRSLDWKAVVRSPNPSQAMETFRDSVRDAARKIAALEAAQEASEALRDIEHAARITPEEFDRVMREEGA